MIACIATKNRYHTKTYKLFEEAGIKTYHTNNLNRPDFKFDFKLYCTKYKKINK